METNASIYVAGHTGLVGSALVRNLHARGYTRIVTKSRAELDLTQQAHVEAFFRAERPAYVFLAAARVGGIRANAIYPAEFIQTNLAIQNNVIHAAHQFGAKRLLFFGSSCAYPKYAPQPMQEASLLTGPLEPTSEPYAMAKLAGISMCAAYNRQYGTRFISAIPATVYGPGDNFDLEAGHVLPALLRRFEAAKRGLSSESEGVAIWGTGAARREFLFVDDLVSACLMLMSLPEKQVDEVLREPVVNIGAGADITIHDLAHLIGRVVGYSGRIIFDATKPDGAPRKQLDTAALGRLGWHSMTSLEKGIQITYAWYQSIFQ